MKAVFVERKANDEDERYIKTHPPDAYHREEDAPFSTVPVDSYFWFLPEKGEILAVSTNGKISFLFVHPYENR